MAAKKGSKKSAAKSASKPAAEDREERSPAQTGKLKGAVWHNGRMYSPKKKGDAEAFAAAIKKEKDGGAKILNRLTEKGTVSGFGTKAAKSKKAAETEPPAGASEPDDELGGGLDGGTEPDDADAESEE